MADEQVQTEQTQNLPLGTEIITPSGNLFSDDAWGAAPPPQNSTVPPVADAPKTDKTQTETKPTTTENEEIVDANLYLEQQTGFKSWDEVKAMKARMEEFEKQPKAEDIKFANEHSQKLFEAWKEGKEDDVYSYLHTQRELKKAADLPASEAIRMHLKQTNPHFKNEDIDDIFDERYAMPKKPSQMAGEEQADFDERMNEYNARVGKINRAIERDAYTAKQELAKRITELVPPEIPKAEVAQGPDPKVLEAIQATKNAYTQKLEADFNNFDAFSTKVKDESVELPIAFKADDKDKAEVKALVQDAVFKNLDVNDYFTNRWFTKDANGALVPDINKMMADFFLLEKTEKVFQGIANNSASSRLAHQIKLNSNITVGKDGKIQPPVPDAKSENDKMLDHFWKS